MASSYAPSVASSRSSASRRARVDTERHEDGQGDLLQRRRSLENGIFGVLFVLSKENSETRIHIRWVLVKVLLDAWQLFTTVINPATQGWRINADGVAWAIVGVLNFKWLSDLGYGAYLALLYAMVVLLAANIGLCVWVAWCFKEQKFPVVWPVKVLRVFSSVFFQAFDVTSLNLLQLGISCGYTGPNKPHVRFQLFPEYSCATTPHIAHAVVSALSLGLFVAIALLLNMAEVEVNPKSRRPMALGHSGPEVAAFAIKVLLTLVDVFIGWRTVAACCYLVLSLALAWQYVRWSPHLVPWMNYLKAGSSVTIVWCSAMLVLLVFHPGANKGDTASWDSAMTTAMLAGLAPAFGAGALMSWGMIRYVTRASLQALANAKPETPLEDVCTSIDDPQDVEVVARCGRVWRDTSTLDPDAVAKAHSVIKAGLAMFPSSPFMVLLHANFMIDVLGVSQSGNVRIEEARKLNPGLMCRFIMFVRRQQATQRAAGRSASDGSNMDLLGYVEYQRKQRMVIRLHREALQAMCNFWKALDAANISFMHLSKALIKIGTSVTQAQDAYRVVLESYGNNPKLVRLYGRFLQTIKNDPWGASEYFAEAERLEELKNGDSSGPLLPDGTPLGRMDEMSVGVLVLNVTGEVQVANRQVHIMFGIKRGAVEGKSITALLAPHCSRWVSTQLAALVSESGLAAAAAAPDGGAAGPSHEAVLVGMHSERVAFAVKVSISRVSGVGEDSTFIALLEPLEAEKDVASLWISHNGTITACDPRFVSFFGWRAYEVNGASITAFASIEANASTGQVAAGGGDVEAGRVKPARHRAGVNDTLARLISSVKSEEGDADGDDEPRDGVRCVVAHKYDSTPIACTLRVVSAESSDTPVYEARIRLATSSPPQLLVVNRKGALLHVSSDLVACLKDASAASQLRHAALTHGSLGPGHAPQHGSIDGGVPAGPAEGFLFAAHQLEGYTLSDFLPAPWKDMHVKYLADTTAASAPRRGPGGCRKGPGLGSTLELRSMGGKPLYMHVSVSTSDLAGELTHVVRMARSSLEEAVAERRLRLSLSEEGLITGVSSGAPSLLFGLEAGKIVGRGVWELVEDAWAGQDSRPSPAGPQAFRALLNRSLTLPGHSWRMQVTAPPRVNAGSATDLSAMARASAAKLAVVQVQLETPYDEAGQELPPSLFMDLWPTASISGVLELEAGGRVCAVLEEGLRPVGLVFGLPSRALVGMALEELVELPAGCAGPGDLLVPHGAKKSSLKAKKKDARVKVGPVHVLPGVHSDGRPLRVEVQVVGRPGATQFTVLLRPHATPMLPTTTSATTPLMAPVVPATALAAPAPPRLSEAPPPRAVINRPHRDSDPVRQVLTSPLDGMPVSPFNAPVIAARPTIKVLDAERTFSASALSAKRMALRSPLLDGVAATSPVLPSPFLTGTGYSNVRTNSESVDVLAAQPSRTNRSASVTSDALRVPDVISGKAAALAGRSKLADLVCSVGVAAPGGGGAGGRGSPQPAMLSARDRVSRTGTVMLTASPSDPKLILLGEPSLPGSATQTAEHEHVADPPKKEPSRVMTAAEFVDADAASDAGSRDSRLHRKQSKAMEANGRIATWVTTKGSFYQNAVSPTGAKSDEDDDDSADHGDVMSAAFGSVTPLGAPRSGTGAAGVSPQGAPKGTPPDLPPGKAGGHMEEDAASDGGQSAVSGVSGVSDQGAGGAEYRRGKRYRKLVKMMDSSQAQEVSQRFRTHALGAIALLAIVHVVCFAVTLVSIEKQKLSMLQLGRSAESQRYMHRILTDVRSLDIISRNMSAPNLYSTSDVTFFLDRIASDAEEMKIRINEMMVDHHFKGSAVVNVLYYTTWQVWDGNNDDDGSDLWTNVTVWDFATNFYNYARDIVQWHDHYRGEGTYVADTEPGQFLLKSGPDLWRASRKALDALLFVAERDARSVDNLQLIFLAVEGAFLSCLAAGYVAHLLRTLAAQRFKLYSTFLVIPVGLTRALASQNTALLVDDDEDDNDNDDNNTAVNGGGPGEADPAEGGAAARVKRHATLNIADSNGPRRANSKPPSRGGNGGLASPSGGKGGQSLKLPNDGKEEGGLHAFFDGVVRRLRSTVRRGAGVNPLPTSASNAAGASGGSGANKRNLRYDSRETVIMITPFVLWSVLVIAVYAVAVVKMKDVVQVVAIHAVANFLSARTYRTVYYAQELGMVEDPALLPSRRANLLRCCKIVTDAYYTLQLGEDAYLSLGPDTERFPLVKNGLAYSSPELSDAFYTSGRCHRTQEHLPCPGPGYRHYMTIYAGIDSMMREFLQRVSLLAETDSPIPPGLNHDSIDYAYTVGSNDLTDGTIEIQNLHYAAIEAMFTKILSLHIILFLLMWVVIAGFLFFLLNPILKRVSQERKHIAELMSQLPLELDVEKLVGRALGTLTGPPTGQASGGGTSHERTASSGSMEGTGQDSDGGADATNKWKAIIRSTSNAVAKQASGNLSVRRMPSSAVTPAAY